MRAGISLPVTSLGDPVVQAHREALQALALAAPGQVVRLSDLSLFDYLVATADETSRRLAPRGLPAVDGVLRSTLDAYASADLNAERAAQRLAVHPNTVHYRLGRVRRLTGRDPRRLPDLVELMAGLRMFPCESA
jgi:sugar diacid utilization regulator